MTGHGREILLRNNDGYVHHGCCRWKPLLHEGLRAPTEDELVQHMQASDLLSDSAVDPFDIVASAQPMEGLEWSASESDDEDNKKCSAPQRKQATSPDVIIIAVKPAANFVDLTLASDSSDDDEEQPARPRILSPTSRKLCF